MAGNGLERHVLKKRWLGRESPVLISAVSDNYCHPVTQEGISFTGLACVTRFTMFYKDLIIVVLQSRVSSWHDQCISEFRL